MAKRPNIFHLFLETEDIEEHESDVSSEGEDNPVAEIDSDWEPEDSEPEVVYEELFPPGADQAGPSAASTVGSPVRPLLPGTYVAKDGSRWSQTPPEETRTKRHNIFRVPPSKIPETISAVDPTSAFLLFITSTMINVIVNCTNAEGRRNVGEGWRDTDAVEVQGLLGCFLLAGAMKRNLQTAYMLWHKVYGIKLLQAALSQKRFAQLTNNLRFDDKETRTTRRARDAFAPIRELWESFNMCLSRHYIPGTTITVDEQLIPWRGRCGFLQYMPSKPDKYGLKIFWACDAENGYPLIGKPYLGKLTQKRELNLGRNIAIELTAPFTKSGRNVTTDNFFTDLTLAEYLLKNGLTLVGTVRRNKTFLPKEFADKKKLGKGESMFAFQKRATLCSHKSGSKKNVILLSTMHNDAIITDKKSKPEIVVCYNETKGGVDVMDQLAHSLSAKRKTRRWPMVVFYNILDLASLAALVIYREKFPESSLSSSRKRTEFQVALAEGLLAEQIRRRQAQTTLSLGLRTVIQECADYLAIETSDSQPGPSQRGGKKRRCSECPWKKDRKSQHQCVGCQKFLCNEHTQRVCAFCAVALPKLNE